MWLSISPWSPPWEIQFKFKLGIITSTQVSEMQMHLMELSFELSFCSLLQEIQRVWIQKKNGAVFLLKIALPLPLKYFMSPSSLLVLRESSFCPSPCHSWWLSDNPSISCRWSGSYLVLEACRWTGQSFLSTGVCSAPRHYRLVVLLNLPSFLPLW